MAKKKLFDEEGNEVKGKMKKPVYKKWWFWLLAIIIVVAFMGGEDEDNPDLVSNNDPTSESNSIESSELLIEESSIPEEIENEKPEVSISTEKEEIPEPSVVQFDANDYNSELTYEDLARNPDEHSFKAVTFEGTIIQVMQGEGYTQYRIAINDDYDQIMLIEIDKEQLDSRILENDYIRIYGTYFGEVTYESTIGGSITVPSVVVEKFEFI